MTDIEIKEMKEKTIEYFSSCPLTYVGDFLNRLETIYRHRVNNMAHAAEIKDERLFYIIGASTGDMWKEDSQPTDEYKLKLINEHAVYAYHADEKKGVQ